MKKNILVICCILFGLQMYASNERKMKEIYFAGGCFWGVEHFFKQVHGVTETEAGFANGDSKVKNPSYELVSTDRTGYVETVRVKYDPKAVDLGLLLDLYFKIIDPTSLNKQGNDRGTRYRTGIYYTDDADRLAIDKRYKEEQKRYKQPLVVEVGPLNNFYTAEEYHQNYLDKHPQGYCHLPQSLFEYARKARRR